MSKSNNSKKHITKKNFKKYITCNNSEIMFSDYFDDDLNTFYDKLFKCKKIIFGTSFDKNIDNIPDNIEELYFKIVNINDYMAIKNTNFLCEHKLSGVNFNKNLNNLPKYLKYLLMHSVYFDNKIDNLPQTMTTIVMAYVFNKYTFYLPSSLNIFEIGNDKYKNTTSKYSKKIINFPNNIYKINTYAGNFSGAEKLPLKLNYFSLYDGCYIYKKKLKLPQNLNKIELSYFNIYDADEIIEIYYFNHSLETIIINYDWQFADIEDEKCTKELFKKFFNSNIKIEYGDSHKVCTC